MDKTTSGIMIQIITTLAVVAGLAIVILELQQSREIARYQINLSTITLAQTEFMSRYGDEVVKAMAKACRTPSELTAEDAFTLDALFNYHVYFIGLQKAKGDLGSVNAAWKIEARRRVAFITGFPSGENWLRGFLSRDPEIMEFLSMEAESIEPTACTKTLKAFGVRT